MELDELKNGWSLLSERLNKNEILNKRIIQEMITTRTQSAYNKLYNYEMFNLILYVFMLIMLPIVFSNIERFKIGSQIILYGCMVIGFIIELFLIYYLSQFNMEKKSPVELSKLALKYKMLWKKNVQYGSVLGLLCMIAIFYFQNSFSTMKEMLNVGSIIFVIGGLLFFFTIRFFNKHIATIQKGLKELEEFEEDSTEQ